ncbi:hypothetical protein YC2023_081487 [Brassica napus]
MILYDTIIRCCPELDQFHGFRSVEVLLETPPGSSKNCPEAKGGFVRVQISTSRPVSVFMIKPRLCPSRVQSSPVKSSVGYWPSPLRSTSCFSPRTLDPKDCGLLRGDPKDCGPRSVESSFFWPLILSIERRNTKSPGTRLECCVRVSFPLLEAKSWQEAKSNLVTVAGRGRQVTK